MTKKYVILAEGLGNKLMHIFHSLHEIDNIIFIWPFEATSGGHWMCKWEDVFEYPKLNIVYSEDTPTTNVICLNNIDYSVKDARWPFQINYGDENHAVLVKLFIDSLIPSREVKALLSNLKTPNNGHVVRAMHPNSIIGRTPLIRVPSGDFLATDSSWVREINPNAIQVETQGAPYDLTIRCKRDADFHPSLREKNSCIAAVADWVMLFRCNIIYEYGTVFTSYSDVTYSSFIHGHRIYGKQVINKTIEHRNKWTMPTTKPKLEQL